MIDPDTPCWCGHIAHDHDFRGYCDAPHCECTKFDFPHNDA